MPDVNAYFPADYFESRARFRASLELIRHKWPEARLCTQPLSTDPNKELTLDWIEADASEQPESLLVFTLGEHGIEAYTGAAMYAIFTQEYLGQLDPATTGLRCVHAINPWGMRHLRRVNSGNVDLNRNFIYGSDGFDPATNPGYSLVNGFINPQHSLSRILGAKLGFLGGVAGSLMRGKSSSLREAVLLGQYRYPQGIYYGGRQLQEETKTLMDIYRAGIARYDHIVHLDMHTGYGPRYQMSVVNSWMEPRSSADLVELFHYPRVVKTDPSEFYSIQGDMIDFVYSVVKEEQPAKRLYATTFEFGTFGDSFMASLRSLREMIFENQAYQYGASPSAQAWIRREFVEMYNPAELAWRNKAAADARQAFSGILSAEGLLARP
jgi:hypothetical protein